MEELVEKISLYPLCKYIVEDAEETFSGIEMVHLEPRDAYVRMVIHSVADLYKLDHYSEGDGFERHIIIKKTRNSLIPSVMVRDYLLSDRTAYSGASSAWNSEQNYLNGVSENFSKLHLGGIEDFQKTIHSPYDKGYVMRKSDPTVAKRMIARALNVPPKQRTSLTTDEVYNPSSRVDGLMVSQFNRKDRVSDVGDEKSAPKVADRTVNRQHVTASRRLFANALGKEMRVKKELP